ncbi:hypothetical protein, partial [Desertibacillus haloalkaliphilus]|uniref:hypothetical protein n=1 Tax=Desertibacillus haloalkaliphilus TaxID=1328930 RepID=UPI001C2588ED
LYALAQERREWIIMVVAFLIEGPSFLKRNVYNITATILKIIEHTCHFFRTTRHFNANNYDPRDLPTKN